MYLYSKKFSNDLWNYSALRKIKDVMYKVPPVGFIRRVKRRIMKHFIEMALWPYRDRLEKQELDFKEDLSFMEGNYIFRFLYQNVLISMFLPNYKVDNLQGEIVRGQEFYELVLLRQIAKKYHKPNMVFLDCGANIGNHTVFFGKIMNAKKIISFEGHPGTYNILKRNIDLNNLTDSVDAYNCVLGEKTSMASIESFDETNIGGTGFVEDNKNGSIKMIALDEMGIEEHIDFVKMDVEGSEYFVLKGMENLLKRDRPVLWVEIFPDKYSKVAKLLNEYGYYQKENIGGANYIFSLR